MKIPTPAKKPAPVSHDETRTAASFDTLYRDHVDQMYRFATRLCGEPEAAKDLVQETFLKAFRFWDKYEKGTNIRAWLFRIMKNSYINRYRREAKEPDTVDYEEIQNFYNTIRCFDT